ncbi:precorrin-4 C(11)-methyltransferase [Thermus sp. LT1-2-5]|uniref:cobalt-precorrin-4/precorrin-4 C(11)-methyltransferase n=1 Tax=Thermus sp. LT1-2-5 TaxID=3026935 RepID=UPI0030E91B7D
MERVVHVVGGGPGDPELLTVKGARLLKEARFVLYTGSLFPEEALKALAPQARLADSKGMVLEEIVALLGEEAGKGKAVRLHSGDPGLYGTLLEEKEALEALGVRVEVVPGVTAAFALAARAGLTLTAPEVAQAVAFTRLGVRTPVPEGQDPKSLAAKGLTLAIYLSGMHPRRLSRELLEAGLAPDTPVLFGHRVGQAGEEVGLTDLLGLARLPARDTTVFLVGEALRARGVRSRLYDPDFRHRYRR